MPDMTSTASATGLARFPRALGRRCLRGVDAVGGMTLFMLSGLGQIFANIRIFPRTVRQIYVIGYQSLFVILLIGIFCGMVLGLQGYYTLVQFGSVGLLGSAVLTPSASWAAISRACACSASTRACIFTRSPMP